MAKLKWCIRSVMIATLFLLLAGCTTGKQSGTIPTYQIRPSPIVSEVAEQQFILTVAKDIDLNNGIWMAFESIAGFDNMPPSKNAFVYAVFNHTDEEIVFDREDFNLSVYWYDKSSASWNEVSLFHYGSHKRISLPAHFEKVNPSQLKDWYVSDEALSNVGQTALRFFILGRGVVSGKLYGAFLDVTLTR